MKTLEKSEPKIIKVDLLEIATKNYKSQLKLVQEATKPALDAKRLAQEAIAHNAEGLPDEELESDSAKK